jgi:5-methylcytosine-specific restriction endonuclease McrA
MYREMVINLLIQRDGPNCGICGKPVDFKDATIDHILELYKDGDHNAKNLRLAHKSCNLSRPRLDLKPKHYDYTIE